MKKFAYFNIIILFLCGCAPIFPLQNSNYRLSFDQQVNNIRLDEQAKEDAKKTQFFNENPNLTIDARREIQETIYFDPTDLIYTSKKIGPITERVYLIYLDKDYQTYLNETCDLYLKTHPKTSLKIKEAMQSKHLVLGMTKEQVVAMWGDPWDIDKITDIKGTFTQWSYKFYAFGITLSSSNRLPPNVFCYFQDNILVKWQNSSPFFTE